MGSRQETDRLLKSNFFEEDILIKNMGKGNGSGEGWGEGMGEGGLGEGSGHGEWKHGVCGSCSPCGDCCLICCCPPIGNMMLAEKMGLEEFQYKYLSLFDYIGGAGIFSFISAMLIRQKVRERYGIDGSNGGDCFVTFCCTTCTICQMTKQVNEEK